MKLDGLTQAQVSLILTALRRLDSPDARELVRDLLKQLIWQGWAYTQPQAKGTNHDDE